MSYPQDNDSPSENGGNSLKLRIDKELELGFRFKAVLLQKPYL